MSAWELRARASVALLLTVAALVLMVMFSPTEPFTAVFGAFMVAWGGYAALLVFIRGARWHIEGQDRSGDD